MIFFFIFRNYICKFKKSVTYSGVDRFSKRGGETITRRRSEKNFAPLRPWHTPKQHFLLRFDAFWIGFFMYFAFFSFKSLFFYYFSGSKRGRMHIRPLSLSTPLVPYVVPFAFIGHDSKHSIIKHMSDVSLSTAQRCGTHSVWRILV